MTYIIGERTESVGTNILASCPARDVLTPVLRAVSVTCGAASQTLYVMSPLGILWTEGFVKSGNDQVRLSSTTCCDNPDGTAKVIAASDLVALTTENGTFHESSITSVGGAGSTANATSAFTYDDAGDFSSAVNYLEDNSVNSLTHMGIHITSLAIANGATISSAVLKFRSDANGSHGETVDYTVYGDLAADSTEPTTASEAEALTLTQSETVDGKTFSGSTWYEFDVQSVLQSIVNLGGWVSGNSVTFIIKTDAFSAQDVTADFDSTGSGNVPYLEWNAVEGVQLSAAPGNDIPFGSLVYYYGDPEDAGALHPSLHCPANQRTVFKNLYIQGGVPSQTGIRAPQTAKSCPMMLMLTNSSSQAAINWASFDWVSLESLQDEGILSKPAGQSAKYFSALRDK